MDRGLKFRTTPLTVAIKMLTHFPLVAHIFVSIGSDNGLAPNRRQAIILTNAGLLSIGTLGTNFSEIVIKIQNFSFTKLRLKISSAKLRPFCFGLNVLRKVNLDTHKYLL